MAEGDASVEFFEKPIERARVCLKACAYEGRRVPDIPADSDPQAETLETWCRDAKTGIRRTLNSADPRHVIPSLQVGSDVLSTSETHTSVLAQHPHELLVRAFLMAWFVLLKYVYARFTS